MVWPNVGSSAQSLVACEFEGPGAGMTDRSFAGPEMETPVNPYSLLEAVNASSNTAHTGWLIFIALMAYLMVAVAGVTHADLLLETAVELPILQVKIQLAHFFQFAPIILVLFHMGLVSQLVLLAKETLEFDRAVRLLEATSARAHPLRLELNNFFFVQAIAGPQRSPVMSAFLHGMSWLTLVVLPVVLLLYVQVMFLPYHDVGITWTHRLALFVDIAMLIAIGVFLVRVETSFIKAFLRTTASHPFSFLATTLVLILVAVFSFFIATVPGELMDRITLGMVGAKADPASGSRQAAIGGIPFVTANADGSLFGFFPRNLVVTDTDLVVDKEQTPGEPSLSLRNRDLRYARLDRTDLHQADLTGANLQGASLVGTDLRNAWLHCADITGLLLTEDRVAANCTSARRADFSRARLDGAQLTGIDARSSRFEEAQLDSASLSYALLTGTDFSSAKLDKADLTGGVTAQGAQFLIASLQGADLTGAQLQFADFSSASMQGAVLSYAHMQATVLRDADLDGASFFQAYLEGADMSGAKTAGSDFRGAAIWMTKPPEADPAGITDVGGLAVRAPEEPVIEAMKRAVGGIESRSLFVQVSEALAPLMDPVQRDAWSGTPDHQRWQAIAATPTPADAATYKLQITDYLGKLMCRARWSSGAVATGVARRAQAQHFRGDIAILYDLLKAESCPARLNVLPKVMKDFASAADLARSN